MVIGGRYSTSGGVRIRNIVHRLKYLQITEVVEILPIQILETVNLSFV